MIKLLVSDLDGTLLRKDGSMSEIDAAELRRVAAMGVKVAFATARIKESFVYVMERLDFEPYLICVNGSQVTAPGVDKPLIDRQLPKPEALALLRELKARGVYCHVYTVEGEVVTPVKAYDRLTSCPRVPVPDLADFLGSTGRGLRKITLRLDPATVQETREWLAREWGGLMDVMVTGLTSAEVFPKGSAKAEGLQKISELSGIGFDEMMGIGDAPNDLDILTKVKWPVAMGNASDDVKQIACHITGTVDECGVAQALKKFLPAGAKN
ncbi:MAG TPA: HAD family hydrolase [Firmicutes bacterium]|nr:HAD family hydrolase [Candidatus Fermentithermobacillaceae bacterium]